MQAFDMRKWMLLFFTKLRTGKIHYIGGADPLPRKENRVFYID